MLSVKQKIGRSGIQSVLNESRVRHAEHDGRTLYAVLDVVAALRDSEHPIELWTDLKDRHPALADQVVNVSLENGEEVDALDLAGVLRLAHGIDSPRAIRLRDWMIQSVVERLEEAGPVEDRRVRRRAAQRLLVDHALQLATLDERSSDQVQPGADAGLDEGGQTGVHVDGGAAHRGSALLSTSAAS